MTRPMRWGTAATGVIAALQWAPALTSITPLRRVLAPALSGISNNGYIALTYDDGPDPRSTPQFLDLLARHNVRATFFLVGEHATTYPDLVRRMAKEGHELAVHGWTHTASPLSPPGQLAADLAQTRELLEDLGEDYVRWYRPPFGVLTTEALWSARRVGLQTVLWSTWGRDWSPRATPTSIVRKVNRVLRPGGTVLLHDTDRESAQDSWRGTLAASDYLLTAWARQGRQVGPLRDHWTAPLRLVGRHSSDSPAA